MSDQNEPNADEKEGNEVECKWRIEFQKLEKIYALREEELNNIIYDCELIRDGWKVIHAVDFDIICEFASPYSLKVSEEDLGYMALNYSRAFVFSKIKEIEIPALLPPFVIELQDHLSYLLSLQKGPICAVKRSKKNDSEIEYEELLTPEENDLLEQVNQWYDDQGKSEDLPGELMNQLIELIEDKFWNLYNLISGRLREETKRIARLVRDGRIQYLTDIFGNQPEVMRKVSEIMSSSVGDNVWYKAFKKVRPRPSKTVANVHDARAVEMVMSLNKFFKDTGRKYIILLLSDAISMRKILNWDNAKYKLDIPTGIFQPEGYNREIRVLRTSKAFLTYMLNEGDDIKQTLHNLHQEKERIEQFKALDATLANAQTECNFECQKNIERLSSCKKSEQELKKHNENYRTMFLNRIIEKRDRLFGVQDIDHTRKQLEPNVKALIRLLRRESPDLESEIQKQYESLEKEMNVIFEEIRSNLISLIGFSSLEKLTQKIQRLWGIPYEIYFTEPRIIDAVSSLFRSIEDARKTLDENNVQEVRNRLNELLSITVDASLGSERNLLLATLFFCYRHYTLAQQIAYEQLLNVPSGSDVEREFLLLECLSCLRLFQIKRSRWYETRALEICNRAESAWKNDPRFENVRGILSSELHKEEEAIEHFDTAINMIENKEEKKALHSALLNNKIYSLCKTARQKDQIAAAKGILRELKEIWPESKWIPEFHHTEGFLYMKEADLLSEASDQERMLNLALTKFSTAFDCGREYGFDERELNTVKKHLELCKNKLEKTS